MFHKNNYIFCIQTEKSIVVYNIFRSKGKERKRNNENKWNNRKTLCDVQLDKHLLLYNAISLNLEYNIL
jgi:hypothetical protein